MAAPIGNQNAAKGKRWSAAIERALEAWPDKPDVTGCTALMIGLNEAAHAFVGEMLLKRDVAFFREFGDRVEGKVAQQTIHSGDAENPIAVSEVKMIPLT